MSTLVGVGFVARRKMRKAMLRSQPPDRSYHHASFNLIIGIALVRHRELLFPLNSRVLICEVSAMSQDKTSPISVIALRADNYSPDGKNVIISLTTKFSTAERKYSVPVT
jgi:hypothetical protein